jgi:hypothetical protein
VRWAAVPIASSEISTLNHEALDDSVECAALIVQWLPHLSYAFLTGTKCAKVLGGLRDNYFGKLV